MTAYYVRSGATGSANGTSWANAYTTLATAISGKAAGDVFYVSEDHSESTSASVTLTFPGTTTNPNFIFCVNHAGSVPPVSADLRTTGSVTSTGVSATLTITGSFVCNGIKFNATGTGTTQIKFASNSGDSQIFKNCGITMGGANLNKLLFGSVQGQQYLRFFNPTFTFNLTSDTVQIGTCRFIIYGGSFANTGTVPTTLFVKQGSVGWDAYIDGVDLSAFGSGKTLFDSLSSVSGSFFLRNCKTNSAGSIQATPSAPGAVTVSTVNCDSGATNYNNTQYGYAGTLTTETTIVRSGGASDGTTAVSHKIVTTANATQSFPFESFPIAIWNDTVGSSVTATVYGIWGGGSVPNNDDVWVYAEYLGDSLSPLASFATGGKADDLASNAALASDASTWGGSTTAFKMSVTFTPQQKGLVYLTVKAAKASSTFYIDPKPILS
jgi:hypothetical protein